VQLANRRLDRILAVLDAAAGQRPMAGCAVMDEQHAPGIDADGVGSEPKGHGSSVRVPAFLALDELESLLDEVGDHAVDVLDPEDAKKEVK
jgi:hypothetical protein